MKKIRLVLTSLVSGILLLSCQKNEMLKSPQENNEIRQLNQKGFKSVNIQELSDRYIIEKDMMVRKGKVKDLSEKVEHSKGSNTGNSQMRSNQAYESLISANTVAIYIDPSVSSNSDWQGAFHAAVADWNGLSNFRIQFSLVASGSPYDVLITNNPNAGSEDAIAELPVNGNPGSLIEVNTGVSSSYSNKRLRAAHALGHIIGFRHTDYLNESNAPTYIIGTVPSLSGNPNPDQISVMNSISNSSGSWIDFSQWDRFAARTIYPLDNTQIPIYRYYKADRHFYTTNWSELQYNTQGWSYEGFEGFIFNNTGSGRGPVYRYYSPGVGTYFYTQNWNELGGGRFGYVPEGIIGYANTSQVSGTVPLYRFRRRSGNNNTHFYTRNYSEGINAPGNPVYEGVMCYVLP